MKRRLALGRSVPTRFSITIFGVPPLHVWISDSQPDTEYLPRSCRARVLFFGGCSSCTGMSPHLPRHGEGSGLLYGVPNAWLLIQWAVPPKNTRSKHGPERAGMMGKKYLPSRYKDEVIVVIIARPSTQPAYNPSLSYTSHSTHEQDKQALTTRTPGLITHTQYGRTGAYSPCLPATASACRRLKDPNKNCQYHQLPPNNNGRAWGMLQDNVKHEENIIQRYRHYQTTTKLGAVGSHFFKSTRERKCA